MTEGALVKLPRSPGKGLYVLEICWIFGLCAISYSVNSSICFTTAEIWVGELVPSGMILC